jgi:GNAT superfamily N-acetyltransferase
MSSPSELCAASVEGPLPQIELLEDCSVPFFRFLYQEVGSDYHWTDRLSWSDDRIREHLANSAVTLWLMSWDEDPAGYFELRRHEDDSVEIAYFGLLPGFIGRGWGKYLLTRAVQTSWQQKPTRVWLHTCTLDHPAALPNYLRRGFRPVREEVYEVSEEAGKRVTPRFRSPPE